MSAAEHTADCAGEPCTSATCDNCGAERAGCHVLVVPSALDGSFCCRCRNDRCAVCGDGWLELAPDATSRLLIERADVVTLRGLARAVGSFALEHVATGNDVSARACAARAARYAFAAAARNERGRA